MGNTGSKTESKNTVFKTVVIQVGKNVYFTNDNWMKRRRYLRGGTQLMVRGGRVSRRWYVSGVPLLSKGWQGD
jgi:hypothetical protein